MSIRCVALITQPIHFVHFINSCVNNPYLIAFIFRICELLLVYSSDYDFLSTSLCDVLLWCVPGDVTECNLRPGPHLPAQFYINPVNMRPSIWKTPNIRDAFHNIPFLCTWVRILACFSGLLLLHSLSVDFLSLLLLLFWSHPWRDTDWFMADVCSLMKLNHAIGLLSQLFVRLFWCCVLWCSACTCDVVWPVQASSSTRFCLSIKSTDQSFWNPPFVLISNVYIYYQSDMEKP